MIMIVLLRNYIMIRHGHDKSYMAWDSGDVEKLNTRLD
jgi:hypothetical protein